MGFVLCPRRGVAGQRSAHLLQPVLQQLAQYLVVKVHVAAHYRPALGLARDDVGQDPLYVLKGISQEMQVPVARTFAAVDPPAQIESAWQSLAVEPVQQDLDDPGVVQLCIHGGLAIRGHPQMTPHPV